MGRVEVHLTSETARSKLLATGIKIKGKHFSFANNDFRPFNVTFTSVPGNYPPEQILNFCREFGTVLKGYKSTRTTGKLNFFSGNYVVQFKNFCRQLPKNIYLGDRKIHLVYSQIPDKYKTPNFISYVTNNQHDEQQLQQEQEQPTDEIKEVKSNVEKSPKEQGTKESTTKPTTEATKQEEKQPKAMINEEKYKKLKNRMRKAKEQQEEPEKKKTKKWEPKTITILQNRQDFDKLQEIYGENHPSLNNLINKVCFDGKNIEFDNKLNLLTNHQRQIFIAKVLKLRYPDIMPEDVCQPISFHIPLSCVTETSIKKDILDLYYSLVANWAEEKNCD